MLIPASDSIQTGDIPVTESELPALEFMGSDDASGSPIVDCLDEPKQRANDLAAVDGAVSGPRQSAHRPAQSARATSRPNHRSIATATSRRTSDAQQLQREWRPGRPTEDRRTRRESPWAVLESFREPGAGGPPGPTSSRMSTLGTASTAE